MTRPISSRAMRMSRLVAPPRAVGNPAIDTLRGITVGLQSIRNDHAADREQATMATRKDPNLTQAGRDAQMAQQQARLADQYQARLDALGQSAISAMDSLHRDEEYARQGRDTSVEGQLRHESLRADARRLFAAGIPFDQQIANAPDADTCWALFDEIPVAFAEAGVTNAEVIQTQSWRAIRRLHELEGTVEEFDAAREGEAMVAGLATSFDLARANLAGQMGRGGGLNAAVQAQLTTAAMLAGQRGEETGTGGRS